MKKNLILITFFILFLGTISFAQESVFSKPKRLAFINKFKLEDENRGIQKLVKAMKEASQSGYILEPTVAKRKAELDRQDKILVAPVRKEVSDFLKQVEQDNNFIILDSAELAQNDQILALSNELDISDKIIDIANLFFETGRMPLTTLFIPKTKIAAIDSKSFTDEKTGIIKIKEKFKETAYLIKQKTGKNPTFDEVKESLMKDKSNTNLIHQVRNYIQFYFEKNGFNFVLDPSSGLPVELKDFPIQDVTNDFISYYNQLNP